MATTSIRYAFISQFITSLKAHANLTNVQVLPGFPGDLMEAESIWVDSVEGDVEIPVMTGGRKQRNDTFEVPWEIRISSPTDIDTVFQRLMAMFAAFEDIHANTPNLSGLDGLLSTGPLRERHYLALTREGHIGFGEVTFTVESRLV